jgi:hypothetical protein
VHLADLLSPGARVLEVGARSASLAVALAEAGLTHHLALVEPSRLDAVRVEAGALAHRFHPLTSPEQAVRNDTDVLVLRGEHARALVRLPELRHVTHVVVEASVSPATIEARTVARAATLVRRAHVIGRATAGAEAFHVIEVATRRDPVARCYLSEVTGVEGLIRRLDEIDISYAALRWFERLPAIDPGEDLDLLVADDHLEKLREVLAEEPGTIPVDLYSETGVDGADYRSMAYYPPALAAQILEGAVPHASGCRVPAPTEHLRSLAYHALYHKGPSSGLPSTTMPTSGSPEHDYAVALRTVAEAAGVDLPETIEGIDEHLASVGWRPSVDTLLRLSTGNEWVRRRFFPTLGEMPVAPEPAVFLVRERTASVIPTDELLATLDHLGFEVLATAELGGETAATCAAETRGGNWGRGPFPRSGGAPVLAVLTLHHAPQPVPADLHDRYPRLSNADILLAKDTLRDLVAARVAPTERFNPIHSSDNEIEAWEYVRLAMPDELDRLRAEVDGRRAAYNRADDVVRTLSRGRRAKVEVVERDGGLAVRKTFGRGYLRHLEREVAAMRELHDDVPAVPEVLEVGDDWFLMPCYDDDLTSHWEHRHLLPLPLVRGMVDVLRRVHEHGWAVIDAKPENFVRDPRLGLKIVDFEFVQRVEADAPFDESYSLVGVPADHDGDVPAGGTSYDIKWLQWTGLTVHELLHASPVRQHLARARYRALDVAIGPEAAVRRVVRAGRRQAERTRPRLSARYRAWSARHTAR